MCSKPDLFQAGYASSAVVESIMYVPYSPPFLRGSSLSDNRLSPFHVHHLPQSCPHSDFWGYFEPIRQFMPKNCSADVQAVVAHFDKVFTSGTSAEQAALKEQYGMSDVTHADDVTGARTYFYPSFSGCWIHFRAKTYLVQQCATTCGIGKSCRLQRVLARSFGHSATRLRSMRRALARLRRAGV